MLERDIPILLTEQEAIDQFISSQQPPIRNLVDVLAAEKFYNKKEDIRISGMGSMKTKTYSGTSPSAYYNLRRR